MADEFDEYEKLLEGNANGAAAAEPGPPAEAAADKPPREKERSSRGRDSEGKRERRDRSRSRERKRDKARDNDFRTDRRSSRSRSRDRRHREERERRDRDRGRGDRDRYRDRGDRGGGRHDRGRDRDRMPPRRRSPTPPEVKLQRERERELAELERATRTVFAFNINIKADERDIFGFFSKAGQVTDIRLITDRHTKRSKGLAYVEFSKQEEVFAALTLTGQLLLNQPVMVKPAEAEKNLAWEAAQAAKAAAPPDADLSVLGLADVGLPAPTAAVAASAAPPGPMRLQVSGFKQGLGDNEIRQIFEPFGPLDSVSVVRDAAGQPLSVAYVVFRSGLDGTNAMTHWHGQSLLDHVLNVTATALDAPGDGAGGGVGELDDEDGGIKINAQKRAALMSRLASSAGISAPAAAPATAPYAVGVAGAPLAGILPGGLLAPGAVLPGMLPAVAAAAAAVPGLTALPGMGLAAAPGAAAGGDLSLQQGLLGPASPIPTHCLLLKNMFDASTQTEPEWEQEVAEDVRDECSKFGAVLHLHVDKNSQGFVYLKFDAPTAAQAAKAVLHGRFYNGHRIEAEYQFEQLYNQFFSLR